SRPIRSRRGSVVAEIYSPQTFRRGNSLRSRTHTDQPARASSRAAVEPAGPPPITRASKVSSIADATPIMAVATGEETGTPIALARWHGPGQRAPPGVAPRQG